MILDWLLNPLIDAISGGVELLPQGEPLPLPSLTPLWSLVQQLDSLIPILGPLTAMLGLLAVGAVFVVVRVVLTVWNLIYP